jgi:hypothetical protein
VIAALGGRHSGGRVFYRVCGINKEEKICMLRASMFGGYGDKRLIFQDWLDRGASLLRDLGSNPNIAGLYLANLKK